MHRFIHNSWLVDKIQLTCGSMQVELLIIFLVPQKLALYANFMLATEFSFTSSWLHCMIHLKLCEYNFKTFLPRNFPFIGVR